MEFVSDNGWPKSRRDKAVHLAAARMPFERGLREEQLAIECHLEAAATTWQQHCSSDTRRPRGQKFSHQTGGSIRVVSDDAELDLEFVRSVYRLGLHARTLRGGTRLRYKPAILLRQQTSWRQRWEGEEQRRPRERRHNWVGDAEG